MMHFCEAASTLVFINLLHDKYRASLCKCTIFTTFEISALLIWCNSTSGSGMTLLYDDEQWDFLHESVDPYQCGSK